LLALGAPVYFTYGSLLRRVVQLGALAAWPFGVRYRLASVGLAPFVGYVVLPYTDFVINPGNVAPRLQRQALLHVMSSIGRKMLVQLRDWTTHDAFRSLDRSVDYREKIRALQLPLLVMGGSKDRLAPAEGAKKQFELAGSPDKTLVIFGRENGDRHEYGHGDLVFGHAAPEEVYPVIARWLEGRASAVELPVSEPERKET
jgi:pimeloyl-ACP methyl ester carboxylesterase